MTILFERRTKGEWKEKKRERITFRGEQTRGISLSCCHTWARILWHWISTYVHRCIDDATSQTLLVCIFWEHVMHLYECVRENTWKFEPLIWQYIFFYLSPLIKIHFLDIVFFFTQQLIKDWIFLTMNKLIGSKL